MTKSDAAIFDASAVSETRSVVWPTPGEVITSLATNNTYSIGTLIGEGHFGAVYGCVDVWSNQLAAKILKPLGTYDSIRAHAESELQKLLYLRHPNITYVYDAFEFRDTFYIVTERCYCPVADLFRMPNFDGLNWLMPIARCLLQAVHYLHINRYAHQDIHAGNLFASFAKDELQPTEPGVIQFKLGDLGVAKLFDELGADNTRAKWMVPPEVLHPDEFGPVDHRADIYHIGLLLLQLASSRELTFSVDEVLAGRPREIALTLPAPYSFAIEKTLRRHVPYRTSEAMELWRDLNSPA